MIDIQQYILTERIHESSDSILYIGYRKSDQEPVTAKLIRSQLPSPRELAKLRHEYSVLKELNIKGVVKTYGIQRYGNNLALILERLSGKSLAHHLQAGPLELKTALWISTTLAEIVATLHQQHIIHKDLKPHNVLVDLEAQRVFLIDFGTATQLAQEDQRAITPEAIEGTLAYMSPEQTGRMNRSLDRRTDLYSLGVTLYEMLTGSLPFTSNDPIEIIHSHIARKPRSPHERASIPVVLSDIVMKLLAKNAEDRYQSAGGLKADLEECLGRLTADGQIAAFHIGQHDQTGELRIPQKLYGRDEELPALMTAFDRVAQGAAELLIVKGYSGVGKSALINETHKAIARHGGHFISGKFDQFNRSAPYASVAQAFSDLVRQLLVEQPETLMRWRTRLETALGTNGQLLVDLIPELGLIIGPQPAVVALGPSEAQNRFSLVLLNFVHVFTDQRHPLVIFLDDLQWADPASLKLIQTLLVDPERRYLLLIGAYRDNEVDHAHALSLLIEQLRRSETRLTELMLKPLKLQDVSALIADTLRQERAQIQPLAEVVFEKTHGNPFFVNQFLSTLFSEKLLTLHPQSRTWLWDIKKIQERIATANVVDFIISKLGRLTPTTQRSLQIAACIGNRFDLQTLATIQGKSPTETATHLWEALQAGIILPRDNEYRFFSASSTEGSPDLALTTEFVVSYTFLHDRLQQAAYSMLDEQNKQELHLAIGRLMLTRETAETKDDSLFDLVNHLNFGAALITDPGERLRLAELNLAAGRKAHIATAYASAADYFAAGMVLLADSDWPHSYELMFALHTQRGECEYLNGHFALAESLFDTALQHASSDAARAHICNLRVVLYTAQGKLAEAVHIGLVGLALFGITIADNDAERGAALMAEIAAVAGNLAGRPIASLVDAPLLTDPLKVGALKLLSTLSAPGYIVSATLFSLLSVKQVNLSLRYGNTEASAHAYVTYGMVLAAMLGQPAEGFEFGKLALALNEKFSSAGLAAKIYGNIGGYAHYCQPLRATLGYCDRAIQEGLQSGDFAYLSYSCYNTIVTRLYLGDELGAVEAEANRFIALMQRTKEVLSLAFLILSKQVIANLQGRTASRASLGDANFDEDTFIAKAAKAGLGPVLGWHALVRMQLRCLYEDYAGALDMLAETEAKLTSAAGLYFTTELPFYYGLAAAAHHTEAPVEERPRLRDIIAQQHAKLAAMAAQRPENHQHKQLLLAAELARCSGDSLAAMKLYDQAISAAQKVEFVHHEALACELYARFFVGIEQRSLASFYMTSAHYGYLRWGATGKAAMLVEKYPHLLLQDSPVMHEVGPGTSSTTTSNHLVSGGLLDVSTFLRAAQAISSEIVLDKVMTQLMQSVLTNAGAQKGYLLLRRDGRFKIEAAISVDSDQVRLGSAVNLDAERALPMTLVQYVQRTREVVILGNASAESRFAADPYIVATQPKSVLCLPLNYQGKMTGILYLENNLASDAFTTDRIELLKVLSSHAAIALENATLYGQVQAMTDQLRNSNEELSQANQRLQAELTERIRAQEARAALQEQAIQVQAERLAEMSTPLIPINDQIVVMPLIGTMDHDRAQQVMETALHGAQTKSAKVVIIDITGMKHVDTSVANTLINTAKALRLLGAQAILSGIRAEVAQALVSLGVDLGTVVTRSTLQSAIAYALGRTDGTRALQGEKSSPRGLGRSGI